MFSESLESRVRGAGVVYSGPGDVAEDAHNGRPGGDVRMMHEELAVEVGQVEGRWIIEVTMGSGQIIVRSAETLPAALFSVGSELQEYFQSDSKAF